MNPQDDQRQSGQLARPGDRSSSSLNYANRDQASHQQATADLIRGQLENIYAGGSGEDTPHTTPATTNPTTTPTTDSPQPSTVSTSAPAQTPTAQPASGTTSHAMKTKPPETTTPNPADSVTDTTSAYRRTMSTQMQPQQPTQAQWNEYHSAWQKYYQLYYERYYLNSVYQQRLAEAEKPADQPTAETADKVDSLSQKEAMAELRENIRQKVINSSEKVKKSRHFKPILAGASVLLLFTFLQYNTVLMGVVAAYVSPGNIDPQNIIVDPSLDIAVSPEPRMIIPKINVDAPVVYGIGPDYDSQMAAMTKGIAHFSIPGANAVPGQIGNAVFAAHSSNDVFATGDYKFVFAQNEKLTKGDVIYMNYEGTRYTYSITSMEVVLPTEVSKVQITTDKPMITLVSCVPLGTAQKRLLIFAEQISPDPTKASASEVDSSTPTSTDIPGRPAPSIIERIFGAN